MQPEYACPSRSAAAEQLRHVTPLTVENSREDTHLIPERQAAQTSGGMRRPRRGNLLGLVAKEDAPYCDGERVCLCLGVEPPRGQVNLPPLHKERSVRQRAGRLALGDALGFPEAVWLR